MSRAILRAALAAALGTACSSGTGAAPPTVTTTATTRTLDAPGAKIDLSTNEEHNVIQSSILSPVDTVWKVLPGVFLELDVEPNTVDPTTHVIANTQFTVRRSLGGVKLSRYVDCGTNITGAAADQMQVTMSLTVQALGDSGNVTTLRTQVEAHGVAEGTSGVQVTCATTGALEARVARMVNDDIAHRHKSN